MDFQWIIQPEGSGWAKATMAKMMMETQKKLKEAQALPRGSMVA